MSKQVTTNEYYKHFGIYHITKLIFFSNINQSQNNGTAVSHQEIKTLKIHVFFASRISLGEIKTLTRFILTLDNGMIDILLLYDLLDHDNWLHITDPTFTVKSERKLLKNWECSYRTGRCLLERVRIGHKCDNILFTYDIILCLLVYQYKLSMRILTI